VQKRDILTLNPQEHKEARDQLLAQAVQNSFECIRTTDERGIITFANRTLLETFGYSEDELIGKVASILLSPANPAALFDEIMAKSLSETGWRGECLALRKDGSNFPCFLSTGLIKDERDQVLGGFGISQDITERKLEEQRMARLAQVVENTSEMIAIGDLQGRITFSNQAWIRALGYSEEELLGKPFTSVLSPRNPPGIFEEINAKTVDGGWRGECLQLRRDGSDLPVTLSTAVIKDRDGRVTGVCGIAQDISARKREEAKLQRAHAELNVALAELEEKGRESRKLSEFVDILQSCNTVEEAYKITGAALRSIFEDNSGTLFLINASRNSLNAVASWGKSEPGEQVFGLDDCWALRRGKLHVVSDPRSPIRCAHVTSDQTGAHICVPLTAQGEALGILHIECPGVEDSTNAVQRFEMQSRRATAVGERISLALANLRLREVLRSQSIRDSLTGLYNRRFMEESLDRELGRAQRGNHSVSLLMLDIDHFKQFNDTHGHQAGDKLLRALGDLLKSRTRGQDVACRFGGEEFAFVLSAADGESAQKRAQLLQEELKHLQVRHGGQLLESITISIGIAVFPTNADSAEALVKAADEALYRAKTHGRNRIIVA
jgi:diguanylate cyclase (GGDEF)-like protein/PAS domain S-box-containing protein